MPTDLIGTLTVLLRMKMEYHIFLVAIFLLLTITQIKCNNTENTPDCPLIYQRFSTSHSYCQPKNQSCNIIRSKLNQQEMNQIVQLHNNYRSTIASQKRGNNGLPAAADMLFMEWDSELAAIAQRHSDKCAYGHDGNDERRVRNFGVGQNIAQQTLSGTNVSPPQPDWSWAIKAFYDEIEHFSKDMICGSRKLPPGHGEIGHFTQVIWSKTFRIGCGYTMYKHGNTYTRYYVCNYGPSGNVGGACVYKEGRACSKCPTNTQCTTGGQYSGLCKRINNEAPSPQITVPTIFYCNFMKRSSPDCQMSTSGDGSWHYTPTLSENYIETILQPGQTNTIVFSKRITASPSARRMCVQLRYRKGPTLAKNQQKNVGKVILVVPSLNDWTAVFDVPSYEGGFRQQLISYSMTLGWKYTTEMKISFAVPNGATPQYFNIAYLIGFDDKCQNVQV